MTDCLHMYRKQGSETKFWGQGRFLKKGGERERHLSWCLKGESEFSDLWVGREDDSSEAITCMSLGTERKNGTFVKRECAWFG